MAKARPGVSTQNFAPKSSDKAGHNVPSFNKGQTKQTKKPERKGKVK